MSNEKFTQGEWSAVEMGLPLCGIKIVSVKYPHGFFCSPPLIKVCEDRLDGESWVEMRERTKAQRVKCIRESNANAHLIAAAPEMYRALEELCSGADEESYRRNMDKAACHYGLSGGIEKCARCQREIKALRALAKARGEL